MHRFDLKKVAAVDTIEQLTVAKILGVFVHCGFKYDNHVDFILSVCSQRVYKLKLLRDRGLQLPQLHNIKPHSQSLIVFNFYPSYIGVFVVRCRFNFLTT